MYKATLVFHGTETFPPFPLPLPFSSLSPPLPPLSSSHPLTIKGVSDLDLGICLLQLFHHLVVDILMEYLGEREREGERERRREGRRERETERGDMEEGMIYGANMFC